MAWIIRKISDIVMNSVIFQSAILDLYENFLKCKHDFDSSVTLVPNTQFFTKPWIIDILLIVNERREVSTRLQC